MSDRAHEKELDALNAGIASLREEMAALATGVKTLAETKAAEPHGAWTDFQHALDETWVRNEKIMKDLAAEIERHPLVGPLAAFGLGFIIAKLWSGGSKQ